MAGQRTAARRSSRFARRRPLFPSQDLLPADGVSNLIAAPLFKPARDEGRTVLVDPGTLESYRDQWRNLSALGRMSPRETERATDGAARLLVRSEVTRLAKAASTGTQPACNASVWVLVYIYKTAEGSFSPDITGGLRA